MDLAEARALQVHNGDLPMSDSDLSMLEFRIVHLAYEADAEKRKHAERLRIYKAQIMGIESQIEQLLGSARNLYQAINNAIEEAER